MAAEKYPGPQSRKIKQPCKDSVAADVPLSQRTMEAVVVFSFCEDFVAVSCVALEKQGFITVPVKTRERLDKLCSQGFLSYLLDCNHPDFQEAYSTITAARSLAPNSFIITYCPNQSWTERLKQAGSNAVIIEKGNISLQVMAQSPGFLQNINSIISQYHKSTRRRLKEVTSRSRMEKATAMATHLSFEHMLQTDANVRAFFDESWPPARHGQYVAIAGGETVAFGNSAKELAERLRDFAPSGNILIQRIECENATISQYAT